MMGSQITLQLWIMKSFRPFKMIDCCGTQRPKGTWQESHYSISAKKANTVAKRRGAMIYTWRIQ